MFRLKWLRVRSHGNLSITETILTVVQSDIGSSSSESFFSTKPTEGVYAVVEVYVDDWFTELDRTLDESVVIERRSVTDGETSTVDVLQVA